MRSRADPRRGRGALRRGDFRAPRSRQVRGAQPTHSCLAGTPSSAAPRRVLSAGRQGTLPGARPQGQGKVGNPGRRGDARPLPPLSVPGRGPAGAHLRPRPEPRRAERLTATGGPARAAGARQPATAPSTSSLRSSASREPASQAAEASIALPAAATARHCAPGPARRGHVLRRRPERSDPRRGPARLRPGTAWPAAPRGPLARSGQPPPCGCPGTRSTRRGLGWVSALPTTAGHGRPEGLSAWGLSFLG